MAMQPESGTPDTIFTRAAAKIRRTRILGVGAAIEINGLVILFGLPLFHGTLALLAIPCGLLLLIIGARHAREIQCENCRGKVDAKAWTCPHCRAELEAQPVTERDHKRIQ